MKIETNGRQLLALVAGFQAVSGGLILSTVAIMNWSHNQRIMLDPTSQATKIPVSIEPTSSRVSVPLDVRGPEDAVPLSIRVTGRPEMFDVPVTITIKPPGPVNLPVEIQPKIEHKPVVEDEHGMLLPGPKENR